NFDEKVIRFTGKCSVPFGRFSIFLVYFWFGILKIFDNSPANPLVASLLERTLPGVSFETFIVVLGVFEMIIAIIFILPHLERLAVFLLGLHLITTAMPLLLLPAVTWQAFMVPSIEGQYIIKNILIIALAIVILAHLHPYKEKEQNV